LDETRHNCTPRFDNTANAAVTCASCIQRVYNHLVLLLLLSCIRRRCRSLSDLVHLLFITHLHTVAAPVLLFPLLIGKRATLSRITCSNDPLILNHHILQPTSVHHLDTFLSPLDSLFETGPLFIPLFSFCGKLGRALLPSSALLSLSLLGILLCDQQQLETTISLIPRLHWIDIKSI
jgi:hypothetical protein